MTSTSTEATPRPSLKVRVQKFGTFLSGMVMPNIGVFIAWGLLAALFIPTGWLPNEQLNELVGPIITYLLPVLIGYTGGRMVHGPRGAAIGALATMGIIVGADVTMLVGGMVMGPFAAWILKKFDQAVAGRIKPGMEMLVDNFSIGILGAALAVFGYTIVNPIFTAILNVMSAAMSFLVSHSLLPLTALIVQPAQVLFLNNAINHGIMIPLGIQEVAEQGKSLLFLVEANGGVWTGVAVAFALFGTGMAKKSAPAAALIMFLGGIAEVVFPYVLAKPKTLIGPIAGNMAGLLTLTILKGGTIAAVSPGSIIALAAMTPRDGYVANMAGYAVAFVVTVLVTGLILKADSSPNFNWLLRSKKSKSEPAAEVSGAPATAAAVPATATRTAVAVPTGQVRNLIFACDAGMGSSVMGVSKMRSKLRKANLAIDIEHSAVKDIPTTADAIITSSSLEARVRDVLRGQGRDIPVFPMSNLLSDPEYDSIIDQLKQAGSAAPAAAPVTPDTTSATGTAGSAAAGGAGDGLPVLTEHNIVLNATYENKWDAIRAVGQLMVNHGYVTPEYIEDMFARERTATVYVGNHLAIPHGVQGSEKHILHSGIVCMQLPNGVSFGEETAYVLVGIAGKNGTHLGILAQVAQVFSDMRNVDTIRSTTDKHTIYNLLSKIGDDH